MTYKTRCLISIALLQFFSVPWAAVGFELNTHAVLSQRAVEASNLNNFLTSVLPFDFPNPDALGEVLVPGPFGTVRALIAEVGAKNEDKPDIRSRHHFHDPTQAWGNAGLRWAVLGQIGQSSVLWSQNTSQGLGGKHSWQDARNSYFSALTATDPAERKTFFAETFTSLGHLIHLVQDAAVPSHARNDSHIGLFVGQGYGFPIGNPDRFHHWANTVGQGQIAGNQSFDPAILDQTYNGLVPIAGIIDATTGDRGTPEAGTNIGIAEYSNGNFFSDDTILKDYAYPNTSQMSLTQEPGPNGSALRFYLRKSSGPGETNYRAAVATRLSGFVPLGFGNQQWELDDNVMSDYGKKLFPRAIGYSAGLIDYFFRGNIGTLLGAVFQSTPASSPPTTVTMYDVVNATPDEETGNGGTLTLVLELRAKFNTSEEIAANTISSQMTANVSRSPVNTTFAFSSLPFPTTMGAECFPQGDFICGSYGHFEAIMIYRGPLGEETDAVVVSRCAVTLMRERFTSGTFTSVYGGEACSG